MNKKSKKTLKNAFNIPEPKRKEEFFNSLPTKQKKSFSFNIPLYISTAVTAVVIIGIWGGIKNLPYFEQPDNIDIPVYSESTSIINHTEKSAVQTTVSSTEKNKIVNSTVKTSGISTVSGTEKKETTVSVQTTIKTETIRNETTITTTKESNNISYKPTTEILTTERTSAPETEFPETTKKTTTATRTTTKTTAKTTTKTTTATTKFHESIFPVTTTVIESEFNHVTTTTVFNGGTPGGVVNVTTQTTTVDIPPQTMTTTKDDNGAFAEPPRDFTVVPAVRYYPDSEIYITDSESTDVIRPPTSQDYGTEIFREMAENSDLIAIVAVDEIIYTGFDGKPYTQENALVMDVIYGDIPANSRISIYCKGGYIPANEYSPDKHINMEELIENNVTVLDYAGNNNFSQVGDSYICFLKKSDGTFPDGSYYLTGLNNISKFALYGDNCMNLNNHQYLTLNEIQSFLNK